MVSSWHGRPKGRGVLPEAESWGAGQAIVIVIGSVVTRPVEISEGAEERRRRRGSRRSFIVGFRPPPPATAQERLIIRHGRVHGGVLGVCRGVVCCLVVSVGDVPGVTSAGLHPSEQIRYRPVRHSHGRRVPPQSPTLTTAYDRPGCVLLTHPAHKAEPFFVRAVITLRWIRSHPWV